MDALPYILKVLYVIAAPLGVLFVIFKIVSYLDKKFKNKMSLTTAFVNYIFCIVMLLASIKLANDYKSNFISVFPFILYFSCGIYLNRIVLRRIIEWHPYLSTLSAKANVKIIYVILWPLEYLCLFIRIIINRLI
jgi:hypothetical protein